MIHFIEELCPSSSDICNTFCLHRMRYSTEQVKKRTLDDEVATWLVKYDEIKFEKPYVYSKKIK